MKRMMFMMMLRLLLYGADKSELPEMCFLLYCKVYSGLEEICNLIVPQGGKNLITSNKEEK